ncbi:MAG: hypothetical protein ACE5GS_14910 [Kiloniellaceae bacterium]
MQRTLPYHLLTLAIVALAIAVLPQHVRTMELQWLRGQAALSSCGPSSSGLRSVWLKAATPL